MRIHSIATVLIVPFAAAFVYIIYIGYNNSDYLNPINYWLLPLLLIIVILFLFTPQINHWWHKRNPPKLASFIIRWLDSHSTFYKVLSEQDKSKFRDRLSVHLESRAFKLMREEQENLPEDFKAIIAHNLIQLTFGLDDYLLDPYERVVVYNHAFPSPKKKFLHTVEVDHEDGVILLSTEHLFPAMLNKRDFYNVGMHAYIEAYLNKYPKTKLPVMPHNLPTKLEDISQHLLDKVEETIGYDVKNKHIIAINYFFIFPAKFKEALPDFYESYALIFNQQP